MNNEFKSLKGHLLLDAGGMYGSSFHHSVILMCQHSPEGAFGLVLNQPSSNCVGEVLPFDLPPSVKQQPVRNGGPVDGHSIHILHSDTLMFQGNVLPNLSLLQDMNDLNDLKNSINPDKKIEVFTGYSGWGPGQIESEISRKSWLIHPASIELVFKRQNESDWRDILSKMNWQQRLLANAPDDLSWN